MKKITPEEEQGLKKLGISIERWLEIKQYLIDNTQRLTTMDVYSMIEEINKFTQNNNELFLLAFSIGVSFGVESMIASLSNVGVETQIVSADENNIPHFGDNGKA